jgi:Flp pilus assembly protein CpaB
MQMNRRLPSGGEVRRLASTRNGMLAVAGLVAVLAAAFLLLFMSRYRDSVNDTSPVTVLVAKGLIEKGTSGDVVITSGMFETSRITKTEEKAGAIEDPSSLRDQVASSDVYPGEQLTSDQFTGTTDSLANKISGDERAISIPLDSAHGMIGEVKTGDHVDVLAGFNVDNGSGAGSNRPMMRAIMQNVVVLRAPSNSKGVSAGTTKTQNMVLKAPDKNAWKFAYASEYGKVWIILRARAGASQTPPSVVTLESTLLGTKPIVVKGRLPGGR